MQTNTLTIFATTSCKLLGANYFSSGTTLSLCQPFSTFSFFSILHLAFSICNSLLDIEPANEIIFASLYLSHFVVVSSKSRDTSFFSTFFLPFLLCLYFSIPSLTLFSGLFSKIISIGIYLYDYYYYYPLQLLFFAHT